MTLAAAQPWAPGVDPDLREREAPAYSLWQALRLTAWLLPVAAAAFWLVRFPHGLVQTAGSVADANLVSMRSNVGTLPRCDDRRTIAAVTALLVRHSTAKIVGLTDLFESRGNGSTPGSRLCDAKINLDFGTVPMSYRIRTLPADRPTWELTSITQ